MPSMHNKSSTGEAIDLEKRITTLESEVDEMKGIIKSKKVKTHNRLRFWTSSLLVVMASIFFVFSVAGLWLKTNIVNTDTWVKKTSEVIQDPNVRRDISVALTDTIFTKFDVNQYVADLLPDRAQPLAGPISSSLRGLTQKEIDKVMQSQAFISTWEKLNRQAHSGLVNSLQKANTNSQNSGDLLHFDGDKLMLNIQPVYSNIKDKLSSKGLGFIDKVAPAQINKQVQIAEAKRMPTILLAFNLINKAGFLMLIPMLIFGIIGLFTAIDRRKALLIFGVSSIVLFIANIQAVYLSKYPFMDNFKNALQSSDSASAQSIFSIYTKDLIYLDRLAIVLMLILVLFAFLTGPAKISVWIRMQISKLFSSKSKAPAVIWAAKNTNYLVTGILAITFLLAIFPLIRSVWYLVGLFIVAGVLCSLLSSLKSSAKLPDKKKK